MSSKAKQLAQRISDRLATIRTSNGYLTDIGARVFRGKPSLNNMLDNGPVDLPCIVLVENTDSVEDNTRTQVKIGQEYIVEGHCDCDPDHPNDMAHDIIADLKRCIFKATDRDFGGLLVNNRDSLRYEGRAIGTREDGTSIVAASIRFTCVFVETLANP